MDDYDYEEYLHYDFPEGFEDEIFENYIDNLVESTNEGRSNEDSMHRTPISEYQNAIDFIVDTYVEYNEKYNIGDFLKIESDIEDWVIDIESSLHGFLKLNFLIEDLSIYNPNIKDYIEGNFYSDLLIRTPRNNLKKYQKEFENISSKEEVNILSKNILIKENEEKINDLFINGYSKVNKMQALLRKFSLELIEEDLNDKYTYRRQLVKNLYFSSDKIKRSFEKYKKYESLFKNLQKLDKEDDSYLNLLESKDLEDFDDKMRSAIEKNQIKLYAKKYLGSYLKMANNETFELFKLIKEKNINHLLIKKELKNIALYNDTETLNHFLEVLIKKDKLDSTRVFLDIEENNLDVDMLYNDDKYLVLNINNFEASKKLGSSQWCISTSESYYNSYLKGDDKRNHLFFYDFTKKETHQLSKIGFTIENKKIINAFDKTNTGVSNQLNNGLYIPEYVLKESFEKLDYINENNNSIEILKNLSKNKIEIKDISYKDIISVINIALKTDKEYLIEDKINNNSSFIIELINQKIKESINDSSVLESVFILNNKLKRKGIILDLESNKDFNDIFLEKEELTQYLLKKKYNYQTVEVESINNLKKENKLIKNSKLKI